MDFFYAHSEGDVVYIPSISMEAEEAIKNTCKPVDIEIGCEWSKKAGFKINEINVSVYSIKEARTAISCNLLVSYEDIETLKILSNEFNKLGLKN